MKAIKQQMEKAIEESTTTKVFFFFFFSRKKFNLNLLLFQPRTSSDVQVGSVRNKWPHGRKEEEIEEEDKEGEKEEEKEGEKEGEEGEKEEEKEEKAKEEEIVKTPALDDEDSILEHTANAVAAVGGLTFDIEFDDKVIIHFVFIISLSLFVFLFFFLPSPSFCGFLVSDSFFRVL